MRDYIAEVKASFPKLTIKTQKLIKTGWDCVVVEINNDLIYLVPRERRNMANDGKLLAFLSEQGLAVPSGVMIAPDGSIIGYSKVKGDELQPSVFSALDQNSRDSAIKQIADFLTQLHGTDLDKVEALGYKPKPADYLFDKVKTWIEKYLPRRLNSTEMQRVERFMNEWAANIGGYDPCLVHCDFSSDHILYDFEGKDIKLGFIDFSDSIIHDPAWDFAKLLDYGDEVFGAILEGYKTMNDKLGIKKRAEIYRERTYVWHLVDPFLDHPYLPFDFETALKEFRDKMMKTQE